MPQNSPFTSVQGATGVTADGQAYSSLAPDKIAYTFTIPELNVNVPLPGESVSGKDFNTVSFSFHTGAAGTYTFRCLDPYGTGPMGMMGPMMTQGYMLGTIAVQRATPAGKRLIKGTNLNWFAPFLAGFGA